MQHSILTCHYVERPDGISPIHDTRYRTVLRLLCNGRWHLNMPPCGGALASELQLTGGLSSLRLATALDHPEPVCRAQAIANSIQSQEDG